MENNKENVELLVKYAKDLQENIDRRENFKQRENPSFEDFYDITFKCDEAIKNIVKTIKKINNEVE